MALTCYFAFQVDAERNGDVIIRGTLEEVTKMMLELGKAVYIQELEAPFLKRSKDFFLCVHAAIPLLRSILTCWGLMCEQHPPALSFRGLFSCFVS